MFVKTGPGGMLTRGTKVQIMDSIMPRLHMIAPNIEPRPVPDSLVQNLTVVDNNGQTHYLTLTLRETM